MEASKKKTHKRQLDINDKSKWGHRFEIRERRAAIREVYTPVLPKLKAKNDYEESVYLSDAEAAAPHVPETGMKRRESLHRSIPRAKIKASVVPPPRKQPKLSETEDIRDLLDELLDQVEDKVLRAGDLFTSTFINCDLRYYNMDFITEKFGSFDVIVIDPPWRIRGGQRNSDSPFMFSNSKA
jgi:hypothetical protein